jgi:PKD repeat protein
VAAAFALGCPDDPDHSPVMPNTKDTNVYLNVSVPDMVVMVAGDHTTVQVDLTTNNHKGRQLPVQVTYHVDLDDRYAASGLATAVEPIADFSFDYTVASAPQPRRAALTIEVENDVQPGIYDHRVEADDPELAGFKLNPAARMRIVILPAGGSIKTAAVRRISAGLAHTLALLDDGSVWAWGDNQYGQLGDGTLIDRTAPVQVMGLEGPVRLVAAGRNHSVALGENGRVYTWGANDRIQLGVAWRWEDNTRCPGGRADSDHREETYMVARMLITRLTASGCDYVAPILEDVIDIAAGDDHTIALLQNREVVSFGRNDHFQLGDEGANDSRDMVKTVVGLTGIPVSVYAGGHYSLVQYSNGEVWGWGDNSAGQLGDGLKRDARLPLDTGVRGAQLIAAGSKFAIARRTGEPGFVSWGQNGSGQLGDGTTEAHDVPEQVASWLPIMQLAAGNRHGLGTLPGGTVYTWGDNAADQMAGATTALRQLSPVIVPRLTGMLGVAAGHFHSLTRHNRCGSLWSWGRNLYGQLGHADVSLSTADPLPIYGISEDAVGDECELALRVWQRGSGVIDTNADDFGEAGCDQRYCAVPIVAGTVVDVTATPAEGYELERWEGDCVGTQTTVRLTLSESKNCIAVYRPIPGIDAPPTASFIIAPSDPIVTQLVAFDASGSRDDGEIVGYQWDFENDGSFDDSGEVATHGFPAAGAHTVRLRVTDEGGQWAESTQIVDVAPGSGDDPTLTVSFVGGGTGRVTSDFGTLDCTDTCQASFSPGSTIYLSPAPTGESVFSHWGIDSSPPFASDCDDDFGIEGCRVEMQGDRTVRVYFE